MKGFIAFLVIFIGGGVFLITSYQKIGDYFLADLVKQEGTPESMKELA